MNYHTSASAFQAHPVSTVKVNFADSLASLLLFCALSGATATSMTFVLGRWFVLKANNEFIRKLTDRTDLDEKVETVIRNTRDVLGFIYTVGQQVDAVKTSLGSVQRLVDFNKQTVIAIKQEADQNCAANDANAKMMADQTELLKDLQHKIQTLDEVLAQITQIQMDSDLDDIRQLRELRDQVVGLGLQQVVDKAIDAENREQSLNKFLRGF